MSIFVHCSVLTTQQVHDAWLYIPVLYNSKATIDIDDDIKNDICNNFKWSIIYKNTESLYCTAETNIVNQLYFNKNQLYFTKMEKKKSDS